MKRTCLRFLTGRLLLFWAIMAIGMVCACTDENPAGEEGNEGNGSTEGDNTPTVSDVIVQINRDVADMQQIAEGKVKVLTCMKESNRRYLVELDNGHVLTVYAEVASIIRGRSSVSNPKSKDACCIISRNSIFAFSVPYASSLSLI